MSLFGRLFHKNATKRPANVEKQRSNEGDEKSHPKPFGKDSIRVIVFRDHDIKGRSLLFDSKVVQRSAQPCSNNRHPADPSFSPLRTLPDIKVIGEMMFGSDAMTYKGSALKIHLLRSPGQLMVTRVFIHIRPHSHASTELEGFDSLSTATESIPSPTACATESSKQSLAHSVPMDMPDQQDQPHDIGAEDSGIASSMTSSYSSNYSAATYTSYTSPASSTDSSIQRRWRRNHTTSLEHCIQNRPSSGGSDFTGSIPAMKRPPKFGLAFVCMLPEDQEKYKHFLDFFFSHITLVENHIHRLKLHLEKAVLSKSRFNGIVCDAVEHFRECIWDLYSTERLPQPVWLNMMCSPHQKGSLCQAFVNNYMAVVDKLNTKANKYFFSSLLTGVLTNHLAWVPTVTPAGACQSRTYLDKHSSKRVDTLARSHPYNPLWAQLGDLYGAIGFPLRFSRVIIAGKKPDLVKRLLYVLSYFIRCSEVCENPEILHVNDVSSVITCENEADITSSSVFDETPKASCLLANLPSQESKSLLINKMLESSGDDVGLRSLECDEILGESGEVHLEGGTVNLDQNVEDPGQNLDTVTSLANDTVDETENVQELTPQEQIEDVEQCKEQGENDVSCVTGGASEGLNSEDDKSEIVAQNNGENDTTEEAVCDCRTRSETLVPVDNSASVDETHTGCRLSHNSIAEESAIETVLALGRESIVIENTSLQDGQIMSKIDGHDSGADDAFDASFELNLDETLQNANKKQLSKLNIKAASQLAEESLMKNDFSELDVYLNPSVPVGRPDYLRLCSTDSSVLEGVALPDLHQLDLQLCSPRTLAAESETSMFDEYFSNQVELLGTEKAGVEGATPTSNMTPGRRRPRHLSTASTAVEAIDKYTNVPMPCPTTKEDPEKVVPFERNFGRSLLAGCTDHYLSDFVLQGTSDPNFLAKLHTDLSLSVQNSVLDERISEAVCLVADTDKCSVKIHRCQYSTSDRIKPEELHPSTLVTNIVDSVHQLCKLRMQPQFCVMHMEDRLQEIYFKSKMLAEYMSAHRHASAQQISDTLGFDGSDLPLLMAVAGTHTPLMHMGLM